MATSSQSAPLAALRAGTIARDSILTRGVSRIIPGTIEKVAGNTLNDYILMARVSRDWSISSLFFANDALTGATSVGFGIVADGDVADGVTAVADGCYSAAVDISAGTAFTERAFGARDIAKIGQYVWQDAGYANRNLAPEWLQIALKFTAATTATGTLSWRIGIIVPG